MHTGPKIRWIHGAGHKPVSSQNTKIEVQYKTKENKIIKSSWSLIREERGEVTCEHEVAIGLQ
jgi:hypothetical protein